MASDTPEPPEPSPAEPPPCSACRSTGKVISNLGGTPLAVDCPWCEGSGKFIPDHDAQARYHAEPPE